MHASVDFLQREVKVFLNDNGYLQRLDALNVEQI